MILLKKRPCEVCGDPNSEWDHLRTRGAGGSDEPSNLQSLCRLHHQERHKIGLKSFVKKYNLPIDASGIYPKRSDVLE